ncbi:RodZ domain-containing protein [Nisaea sp.]|uniref:helix-turn-helix domain-containing protein n=1 Tax=Nisaea sp. TaxID=2024842 RepID=UPI00329A47BA
MSAKEKLRLRHIEDAAKPITIERTSSVTAKVADVSLDISPKATSSRAAELLLSTEAGGGSAVGAMLRQHRVERDFTVQDIAQQLRIQRSYLQALEEGDFDNLPGLTYAIGYVRSYAKLLDLDPDTLIADFKAEAKKLQEPTQLSFPSPAPEGKVPGGAMVFVGVLLAAISYGGWYYFSTAETAVSDLTPGIPDRLAFLLEEPAIDTPAAIENATVARQPAAAIAATQAPNASAAATSPTETESVIEAATVAPVSQEPAQQPAAPAEPVATSETAPAATETVAATPEVAAAINTETEIPAAPSPTAPSNDETVTAAVAGTESVSEATPTIDTPASNDTTPAAVAPAAETVEQIASVPDPTPGTTDIPGIPEVPVQEAATTSRSVVEAEAAAIDSKPKPVSAVAGPFIVISATDDSWVQVRGTDATPLLTRILRKGEQYEVPSRTGLKLFTGNAGALKISVNGSEAPSLGPFGKIARNIPLDETLLTYTVTD